MSLIRQNLQMPEQFDVTTAGRGVLGPYMDYEEARNQPITANDAWQASKDAFDNKTKGDIAADVVSNLGQFADEGVRTGSNISKYGLAKTVTGRANVSGFGAGSKGLAKEGMAALKARNVAGGLNAGMAVLNVGGGIAAGIQELTGRDYDPLTGILSGGKSLGKAFDENGDEVKFDESGNPILNLALDEDGKPIIGPDGKHVRVPIMRGARTGAMEKSLSWLPESVRGIASKAGGFSEAALNSLSMGGYDAMRANVWGGNEYVKNRKGNVDVDPYNVGKGMEYLAGKAFDAWDNWRHPKSAQRLIAEEERRRMTPASQDNVEL